VAVLGHVRPGGDRVRVDVERRGCGRVRRRRDARLLAHLAHRGAERVAAVCRVEMAAGGKPQSQLAVQDQEHAEGCHGGEDDPHRGEMRRQCRAVGRVGGGSQRGTHLGERPLVAPAGGGEAVEGGSDGAASRVGHAGSPGQRSGWGSGLTGPRPMTGSLVRASTMLSSAIMAATSRGGRPSDASRWIT
jgi:hypothetical protein